MATDAGGLAKVGAKDAAEVCRKFKRSPAAAALPAEGRSPAAFLDDLGAGGHLGDIESFLAFALPKREAVWWACLCAREAAGPGPAPEVVAALDAAEAWAADPTDPNRRAAMTAGEALGFDQPAGCVALAAFFSGGSLAPAGGTAVPPAEPLTARMVAASLRLSAAQPNVAPPGDAHRRFVGLGLDVARGKLGWDVERK